VPTVGGSKATFKQYAWTTHPVELTNSKSWAPPGPVNPKSFGVIQKIKSGAWVGIGVTVAIGALATNGKKPLNNGSVCPRTTAGTSPAMVTTINIAITIKNHFFLSIFSSF
jgi:hypothetical protein